MQFSEETDFHGGLWAVGYLCPFRVFFLRKTRGGTTTTYGSMPRSGRIIGKATILFHVAHTRHAVSRVCAATKHTYTQFSRSLFRYGNPQEANSARKRWPRTDTWAHTDSEFSKWKAEKQSRKEESIAIHIVVSFVRETDSRVGLANSMERYWSLMVAPFISLLYDLF